MDDRTFDQKSALEWISTIENPTGPRDGDIYPRLKTWIDQTSPLEILEIGCGQGVCSDKIDLNGRRYTGAEPSPFLVERAQQLYRAENRRFLPGNAYGLPFSDGHFNSVFSVAVWHLLKDLKTAAAELSRVLNNNGHFLLITANPGAYSAWTASYTASKLDGRRFEGQVHLPGRGVSLDVLYLHTLAEILDSLHTAGLTVQETLTFRPSEKSDGQGFLISIRGQKLFGAEEPQE